MKFKIKKKKNGLNHSTGNVYFIDDFFPRILATMQYAFTQKVSHTHTHRHTFTLPHIQT